ncbi:MAG: hypothetical protein QM640_06230 [Niabella sp.]
MIVHSERRVTPLSPSRRGWGRIFNRGKIHPFVGSLRPEFLLCQLLDGFINNTSALHFALFGAEQWSSQLSKEADNHRPQRL